LVVGTQLGDLPKELNVGRPWRLVLLVTLDFVGGGDEVPRELLEAWIRPDKLSVE
jgi:hypothetical protein